MFCADPPRLAHIQVEALAKFDAYCSFDFPSLFTMSCLDSEPLSWEIQVRYDENFSGSAYLDQRNFSEYFQNTQAGLLCDRIFPGLRIS